MKRLLFVPGFTADTYNSIQRRYVALTRHLRGRLDLTWCLPPDDPDEWIWADPRRRGQTPDIVAALSEIAATVVRLPIHRGSPWNRARRFRHLLAKGDFAGVYAAFAHRFPPLYAGKRAEVTTIWDAAWNSLEPPHRLVRAKAMFYRRYIERFVAATPLIADSLRAHGIGEARIFVRWSAIDTHDLPRLAQEAARRSVLADLALPADARIVLQLTSYLPSKNTAMAVRVMNRLKDRVPALYWLLAGEDGPETSAVRELAQKLDVRDRMVMLGHRRDVWSLMASADAVAMTSRQDGLPNALLEAMASRRPIVSTRAQGPEYLVRDGENGFLVNGDDDLSFAECLVRLLENRSLAESMGRSGYQRLERDFTMQRWCERLGDHLCECLEGEAERGTRPMENARFAHCGEGA